MNTSELSITIRRACAEDAGSISALGAKVFLESYKYPHQQEDMAAYLVKHFSKEKILKELSDKNIFYFVASAGGLVGFIKVNANKWTWRFKGRLTFEFERLYIQNDMVGKGIGSRLMKTALKSGRTRGFRIIWLSVWKNNEKSIAFHERHGFTTIGEGVFTLGGTQRTYLVMQRK